MNPHEELVTINGHEVVINHTPVRMFDDTQAFVGMGTLNDVVVGGYWCRSVHAWMINPKGELFLHQRSFKVLNNPGKWGESFGGYVDGDMTEEATLTNEIHEEIGLSILHATNVQKLGEIRQYEKRFDGSVSKQFVSVFLVAFDFSEKDMIALSDRDVIQGRTIHWRTFQKELAEGKIDFVDHPDELALVFATLQEKQ